MPERSFIVVDKAMLEISVYLADVEPVKSILGTVEKMISDDRVPAEYRFSLLSALSPYLNKGKTVNVS